MRISDWSSDVCSSDLPTPGAVDRIDQVALVVRLDVLELEAVGLGDGAGALHVVVERGRAVDGGLAIAEPVQVGAVQQEDSAGQRGPPGFFAPLIPAKARRALASSTAGTTSTPSAPPTTNAGPSRGFLFPVITAHHPLS